jgi:ribonuclease III
LFVSQNATGIFFVIKFLFIAYNILSYQKPYLIVGTNGTQATRLRTGVFRSSSSRKVCTMELPQDLVEPESLLEFAERLNLSFSNLRLLSRALTHRSYLNEHPDAIEDNERLEFLGDAVLDFLVGSWLYHHMPEMAEGRLTSLRAALVRNDHLAVFAQKIDLGSALRLGRGEDESGGRYRSSVLGSAFEALIGAIYLDGGLPAVEDFIEPFLEDAVGSILLENKDRDSKSQLQEYTQANGLGTPSYVTISVSGPDHQRIYEVAVKIGESIFGVGQGRSKQAATKAAATEALRRLELI